MQSTTATAPFTLADLAQLHVFRGCTNHEIRRIDRLVTPVDTSVGRVLCRQGELGRECFVVLAGRAVASVDGSIVGTIEQGHLIGEIALLAAAGRRTATVIAETDMRLLVLTRSEFTGVLAVAPSVAPAILRETTRRLLQMADDSRGSVGRDRIPRPVRDTCLADHRERSRPARRADLPRRHRP
jgi:CRP-like cAMP-binding protein